MSEPNERSQEPAPPKRVLPVLEYRTVPRSSIPSRTLFASCALPWTVLMMIFGGIGTLATYFDYDAFQQQDQERWFQNELERRTYEMDRLTGYVPGNPPALYRRIYLHPWVHWLLPLFPLAMIACGIDLRIVVKRIRRGVINLPRGRRSVRWCLLVPSLFLVTVACEYRLQSWHVFSFDVAFVGWLSVGTILMAWWTWAQLESPTSG